MALSDLRREMVLSAIEEYDKLGRDAFLEVYRYGPARGYFLLYDGKRYDSKAIAGVAHRDVDGRPLRAEDFSGGNATVARALSDLGFEVTRPGDIIDGHSPQSLLQKIGTLKTAASATPGARKRHQPLALLWALGRVSRGDDRLVPWRDASPALESLLREFGHPGDGLHAEFPVLRLYHHGLWDLPGRNDVPRASGSAAQRWMRQNQPLSGLRSWVHDLVTDHPAVRAQIVLRLLDEYFRDVDRDELLAATRLAPEPNAITPARDEATLLRDGTPTPSRRTVTTNRVIRDSALAEQIKLVHNHQCQICDIRLTTRRGPYAEGAHIRPLGTPHNGPDEPGNLLCLCPNHHVLFDGGTITITDDLVAIDVPTGQPITPIRLADGHTPDPQHLAYHRHISEDSQSTGAIRCK
ncbi:HNH endonuclease [Sphaerisporangium perillae]|uniref:HNH endonuclease n=1 Tax=Sphaerisporangium perillae TaxID=2935860 RepID=UPI00200CCF57|nr:HNH endonuclease [Sphaerisporangium perillae]